MSRVVLVQKEFVCVYSSMGWNGQIARLLIDRDVRQLLSGTMRVNVGKCR